jgi:hypothetical protein
MFSWGIPYSLFFHKPVQSAPYKAPLEVAYGLGIPWYTGHVWYLFVWMVIEWWYKARRLEDSKYECNQDYSSMWGNWAQKPASLDGYESGKNGP